MFLSPSLGVLDGVASPVEEWGRGWVPVQADMLSACIEYEDILSDKQRGAHPSPPKGREPDTHPQPLPKGGGQGTSTYTFRRIAYPPEQIPPSPSLGVIDAVASLVEE